MKHALWTRAYKLLNVVLITAAFASCWLLYYSRHVVMETGERMHTLVIGLFLLLYAVLCRVYDALMISYSRTSELIFSQILAFLISDVALYIVICILTNGIPNIIPGLAVFFIQIIISGFWIFTARSLYFKYTPPKKSAVIYDSATELESLIEEYGFGQKFDLVASYNVRKVLDDLELLSGMEVVFLRGIHSKHRNVILKYCIANSIQVFVIPRVGDVIMSGATRMHMFHLPVLRVYRYNPNPEYVFAKRFFDIVLSGIGLIITSPIFLVTAIAVKKDGGPAFYKQKRLTKDGKEFYVLKFRSMRVDAEKDGVARLSTGENDDRITKVGRKIRALRIDELPQLINIFKGDMSIVGPRPERPEIAAQYEKDIPEFRLRLQAKAGLTGYAQVYGKYNTSPYDKLLMDLMYISNPSLWEDLRICFATVKIIFVPESTEGIEAGKTTAAR